MEQQYVLLINHELMRRRQSQSECSNQIILWLHTSFLL